MNWPWEELGLPGPAELPLIRKAYAERLKEIRPEEDPEGFQRLHSAYQTACRLIRQRGGPGAESVSGGSGESGTGSGAGNPSCEGDAERHESGGKEGADDGRFGMEQADDGLENEPVSGFKEKKWDFERLFAEGAAEERGRRFQRLMELRRKNRFRYDTWRPRPSNDPAEAALNWMAVSRAAALLEELTLSGAEAPLWQLFCKSELFERIKHHPDFVFALEDFLREYPEIPEAGRGMLFQAYGLDMLPIRGEYRLLYQLLNGKAYALDTHKQRLTFGRNRSPWHTRGTPPTWKLLVLFPLVCAVLLLNLCVDLLLKEDFRQEQVCAWMGEDFGREFVRMNPRYFETSFTMLDTRTETYFRARWDGPRDRERGRRGYVTDYTQARITEELTVFAERWNWSVSRSANSRLKEQSTIYLYVPLTGAGQGLDMLKTLLSSVSREDWYQELPPEYTLYLCWGDWSFYKYDGREDFDGPAAQWYYERFFGPELCRIVLEETGVASVDIGEGLLFPAVGTVKIEGRRFFHVAGTEIPPKKALFHYFLSEDGTELFCVPAGGAFSGLTLEKLYQMEKSEHTVKGFPEKLSVFHAVPE